MKFSFARLFIYVMIAALLSTGCSSPTLAPTNTQAQASPSAELVATTSAPTMSEVPTATQQPTATAADTSTLLPTAAIPATQQPLPTETPGVTETPAAPPASAGTLATATINENTNCRTGPSSDYTLVMVFMSGITVKIVANSAFDDYVIAEDPANPSQSCWLWTKYVTINGSLSNLPVATPPPPLVNFTTGFTMVKECEGYSLEFKVINTGTKTLQAYTIVAKDITAHTQQTTSSMVFDLVTDCTIEKAIGYIDPGKVGYLYGNDFTYNPAGHSFEATITICSHNDMTGVCETQVIKFTP
ncbi:MAG: hypothetical protein C3F13_18940 [Anaerolineales bacterium]|nr:hypothetical protein [Anaerolineae bacterium]PWB49479.1 MAG: hypothetical protein C3F13_18940 [Anaerolineales bacterium]